jgi:hypothetical protein
MDKFAVATSEQLLTGLSQQHAEVSRFVRDLIGPIYDLKKVEIARQELAKRIQPFGDIINKVIMAFKPKAAEALYADLIVLADSFDYRGHTNMADTVDEIISNAAGVSLQSLLQELGTIHHGLSSMLPATAKPQMTPSGLIDPWGEPVDLETLKAWIADLGKLIAKYSPYAKTAATEELIRVADYLDESGFCCLADMVDGTSELFAKCATYIPKMRNSQVVPAQSEPIQPPREGNLSTRYCPDHVGVQAARISEHIYQCPLDGKVYNYEVGYVNYQGQRVLGGSVAEQTPATSDFGGIPMQVYDSRQNVLNSIY